MAIKLPIEYEKYRVRRCRYVNHCQLCGQDIKAGQFYHDGGYARRAHVSCAEKLGRPSVGSTGEKS